MIPLFGRIFPRLLQCTWWKQSNQVDHRIYTLSRPRSFTFLWPERPGRKMSSTMAPPPPEPESALIDERIVLVGTIVASTMYGSSHGLIATEMSAAILMLSHIGMIVLLYFTCFQLLWQQRSNKQPGSWFHLCYITTMFATATVYFAAVTQGTQLAWIDERNNPGGPLEFLQERFLNSSGLMSSITATVADILAVGLLVCPVFLSKDSNALI